MSTWKVGGSNPPGVIVMSKDDEEKKARRKKILDAWSQLDDIPPCKFCGRVVLAGVCCQKRLDSYKKFKYKK